MASGSTTSKPTAKRSRDPWETRSRILDAAEELVLTRGFGTTSVDGVCARAGVTKGAFFHHFGTKDAMCHELVSRFAARSGGPLAGAVDPAGGKPAIERFDLLLDAIIRSHDSAEVKGCLVGMCSLEFGLANADFRARCGGLFNSFRSMVENLLAEVKNQLGVDSPIDPGSLAVQLIATIQGAMVVGRATDDPGVMRRAIEEEYRAGVKARLGRPQPFRQTDNQT